MTEEGKQQRGCGRRGRPRRGGRAGPPVQGRCFEPCRTVDASARIYLTAEELEALRLVDLMDLNQEEAARQSGISRRTLWKDLHGARKKVADALVSGRIIEIEGCTDAGGERCPRHPRCRQGCWFDEDEETPDEENAGLP
jgi:predicted DNA-binding protein (UPF0251 family)